MAQRGSKLLRDPEIKELLSAHGLKVTEQRMLILRELSKLRVPVSHPELTERLADTTLDRATIYRNLLSLNDAGILVRAQLGDNVWRFELPRNRSSDHGHHPHLVCTDCGAVRCLAETTVSLHGEAARSRVTEVQLRGQCADCSR